MSLRTAQYARGSCTSKRETGAVNGKSLSSNAVGTTLSTLVLVGTDSLAYNDADTDWPGGHQASRPEVANMNRELPFVDSKIKIG